MSTFILMNFIKNHSTQILIHLLFWMLFVFVSLFIFSNYYWKENPFLQFLLLLLAVVYFNNGFLLPFFVKKKWYAFYGILFALIAFITTKIYCDVFAECGCSIKKCMSDYLWQTLTPLIFFSFVWVLFLFIDQQNEVEKMKQERTEMELKFLKNQINPHVLFNNLNTIYSYSIEKPSETPDLILKLSDNLKHVLYESSTSVSLEKELNFIDNYIDFQRIRTEGIKEIKYKTSIENKSSQIAPLLLITLIENAFKHSLLNSTILINITQKNGVLTCVCENNYTKEEKSKSGSIGLNNLKKRLQLLYKGKYELTIDKQDTFKICLKMELR